MKKKILLWLIKRMNFDSYTIRTLMFKLQCHESADAYWQEVKKQKAESGCASYEGYVQWLVEEIKRM